MIKRATDFLGITQSRPQVTTGQTQTAPPTPDIEKVVYMSWDADSRPNQAALSPKLIKTLSVVGVVISLLLVLMGELGLILVVGSIIFMVHILSKTPPETVHHELSNIGVVNTGKFYHWNELTNFFFTTISNTEMLAINSTEALPGRLFFLFDPAKKQEIKDHVQNHLPYLEEEPLTVFDKIYYQILGKFNFDK